MTKEYNKIHECLRRHKGKIINGVRDTIKDDLILAILIFIPFFVFCLGEIGDIKNVLVLFCLLVKISTMSNLLVYTTFAIIIVALNAILIALCKFTKHKAPHLYKGRPLFRLPIRMFTLFAMLHLITFALRIIR